jgi:signal transduction histidine kinase
MTSSGRTRNSDRRGYHRLVDVTSWQRLPASALSRGQLIALDGLAAAGLLVLRPAFAAARPAAADAVPLWAELLVVAGVTLPVALRRVWPLPVFAVVGAMTVLGMLLGVLQDPFIAASFALYTVALSAPGRRRGSTLWLALVSVGALVLATGVGAATPNASEPLEGVNPAGPPIVWTVLLGLAVLGGTWTVGRAVAERRAYAARAAVQLAHQAVTDERLRIARELHDIVAHSMSLIAVKAGVANHVLAQRPREAADALKVIETTSRSSLNEMRQLLGVLRAGGDAAEELAELGPAPGPDALGALAERAAHAGVDVDLDVRGVDGLPEGVGLSVYRIVQEALTNVVKHAAPARCQVTVAAERDAVHLDVTDDGGGRREPPREPPREPAGPAGHGLIGMRERVMLYGGSLAAEPRPEGGFRVSARLPCQPGDPSGARW